MTSETYVNLVLNSLTQLQIVKKLNIHKKLILLDYFVKYSKYIRENLLKKFIVMCIYFSAYTKAERLTIPRLY